MDRPRLRFALARTAGEAERRKVRSANLNIELFPQLAHERRFRGFSGIYLATREFPEPAMHRSESPSVHEDQAGPIDQRPRHDEQRCRDILHVKLPD